MQYLLFLAQVHYAMAYNMEMLTPSLFVCNHSGFEPNLKRIFCHGRGHLCRRLNFLRK